MARKKQVETVSVEELLRSAPKIGDIDILQEIHNNFEEYTDEVNIHRAIPHVLFGSKPVIEEGIWSMWVNKRKFDKPYAKSASVVGEMLAYYPHGDASAYDSLARLTQKFVYQVPMIDGHGSFGSIVGGPRAAAPRYTEMRLSEFTQDVLFYNPDILEMGLNYLDDRPEPIIQKWTALLPILFMTNSEGVGYPISNTWSSCNLYEFRDQLVNYLKTGKVDCSKIFPDFPTGGIIVNKSEMQKIYETGKGTIILRGEAEIIGDVIKITSLPYQVFPEDFIESVKDVTVNKESKKRKIETIVDVSDRSDKNGVLIEIDCKPETAEYTLEFLYRNTKLQQKISDEHKAINPNNVPILYTLLEYMKVFVDANIEVVKKEAQFNLDKINDRLELVMGLLNALDIIDQIIATIKKSKSMEDAKLAIMGMKKYKFTERQADYIVHTALGRLANLEQIKLQDEKKELDKQKAYYEDLLTNEKSQKKYFLNRFNKLVDKYGWERKTELVDVEIKDIRVAVDRPTVARQKKEFFIVLTDNNCLKRIEPRNFRSTDEDSKNIKVEGNQKILLVSNKGMMYKVPTNQIDLCMPAASGTPIADLRPEIGDEKILAIYDNSVDLPYIFFVTKEGNGKCGMTDKYLPISKDVGATFCSMKTDTDEIIAIKLLNEDEEIEVTTNQRTVRIEKGIPQGRNGSGRNILRLRRNEEITGVKSVKI